MGKYESMQTIHRILTIAIVMLTLGLYVLVSMNVGWLLGTAFIGCVLTIMVLLAFLVGSLHTREE